MPELDKFYIFSFAGECPAEIEVGGARYKLGGATFWVKFSAFFDAVANLDAASIYRSESRAVAAKIDMTKWSISIRQVG